MYAGCVAGALPREGYLQIIRETGFVATEVKQAFQVELPEALLEEHLSDAELEAYQSANNGLLSITVFGKKPVDVE